MSILSERLVSKRREKGWSQRELARHAGVSHTIIADIEKGTGRSISVDAARRIARALGVGVDYLVGTFENLPEEDADTLCVTIAETG